MATTYLELPPDELDPTPGLMLVDASGNHVQELIREFGATEVSRERAVEIMTLQNIAEGIGEAKARYLALRDLGEWEEERTKKSLFQVRRSRSLTTCLPI